MHSKMPGFMRILAALAILMVLFTGSGGQANPAEASGSAAPQALISNAPTLPSPLITSVGVHSEKVQLEWKAISGAVFYTIYRSLTPGENYSMVGQAIPVPNESASNYWDLGLTNGTHYFYVVTATDSRGIESWYSDEIETVPHVPIEWAGQVRMVLSAGSLAEAPHNGDGKYEVEITTRARTYPIEGEVFITNLTGPSGPASEKGLIAQVGMGPLGTAPSTWTNWVAAQYVGPGAYVPANDRYQAQLIMPDLGEYDFVYRFSMTGGFDWVYGDRFSIVADPTQPVTRQPGNPNSGPGVLHVTGIDETDAPAAPTNLRLVGSPQFRSVALQWDQVADDDLLGYKIFRAEGECNPAPSNSDFILVGHIISTKANPQTTFTDRGVAAGATYCYNVRAHDYYYNESDPPTFLAVTTPGRPVALTVNASVPAFTPGTVYLSLCALYEDNACKTWGSTVPMTPSGSVWTATIQAQDGEQLLLYFHRGDPATTGQALSDGDTLPALVPLLVEYGQNGTQTVTRIVTNWRDPIVAQHTPSGQGKVPPNIPITITWNQPMPPGMQFVILDAQKQVMPGVFTYDPDTYTFTFTPDVPIPTETSYTVEVTGKIDLAGDVQQVPLTWEVTTGFYTIFVPVASQ